MAKRGRKTNKKETPKAKDPKGYLDSNKDKFTDYKIIRGNKITMEGVSGKIYAIPIDKQGNAGKGRLMKSGENHTFDDAAHVVEIPEVAMAKLGVNTGNPNDPTDPVMYPLNPNEPRPEGAYNNSYNQWLSETGIMNMPYNPDATSPNPNTTAEDAPTSTPNVSEGYDFYNDPEHKMKGQLSPEELLAHEEYSSLENLQADTADMASFTKDVQAETQGINNEAQEAYNKKTKLAEEKWLSEGEDDIPEVAGDNTIDETQKIQFDNPYGGVDIPTAAMTLGSSLSYDGDKKGANTARGVASGLKLLTGLGRNVMSGYAQNKRNQWNVDEYNSNQKSAMRKTTNLQAGGELNDNDVANINEATGIEFNPETARSLFGRTPEATTESAASLDFGKYSDVGYFEEGEMHNGRRVIHNTQKNPMNYDDNRRNALRYLQTINDPDSFEFQYRDSKQRTPQPDNSVVSRQKGGKVSAAELLSGTVMTGDPTAPHNVEVEQGEHVKDNQTGKVQEVVGKKHGSGGERMNLEDHKVLSDHTKIGGDLAKKYRDEFDVKVKAKDTYSTVMDKVLKKTGYKSITDELTSTIEKTQKEQEKAKDRDSEATTGINMQFLSGKINDLTKELEPLEELKSGVFETLFADQQGNKTLSELREEGDVDEAQDGKVVFKEGDNPNEFTNPETQPMTNEDLYLAGTVTPENYKETMLQLLEEFPNLVQENFEVTGAGENIEIKPRFGQDSVIGLQEGINEVYNAKISEAENITDPVKRQEIIDRLESEKFNADDRYKGVDGLIGNFTASRRNFTMGELSGESTSTESTNPTEAVVGDGEGTENEGTGNRTALLPDQHILPPSAMQPHRLSEITPREAEAKLISPNTQIEEINRQFMTAKSEINNLPDSQRRAALAQLNAQTQQSINQVMSQTNRANAQIEGQNEERNIQRQTQSDIYNEQAADVYEKKQLTAMDKTEQDIRNYFNAQNKKQVANYNTIQNMNLTNAMYDNFQYDGNGRIIQTGKGLSKEDIANSLKNKGYTQSEVDEILNEKKTTKAKRGRKTK